jgi:methyl-accepting chemotaxis protein
MLAGLDLKITYVNPASMQTLKKLEKHLPIKAENIIGTSIDVFHRNPSHQRKLLSDDRNLPVRTEIQIGPEFADLLVTAIYDHEKRYLGPMVTEKKIQDASERERHMAEDLRTKVDSMLGVVNAASHGDLTRELDVFGADSVGQMGEGLSRFFSNLRLNISSISEMAQTLAGASRQLTAVSQQMASNAEETAAQANVSSAAAEEVSKNVATVATAAEQMSRASAKSPRARTRPPASPPRR